MLFHKISTFHIANLSVYICMHRIYLFLFVEIVMGLMNLFPFLVISSFLVVVEGSDSLLSPKGVNYEVAALMSMKSRMGDVHKVFDGWDLDSVDPCTWVMIGCSSDGFVISLLTISTKQTTLSPLPKTIRCFLLSLGEKDTIVLLNKDTILCEIELTNKGLSGTLSPSIGNLSHLQTMLLQHNQLSGPMPSEIGILSQLTTLDLSSNQFTGEIPSSLGHLTRLNYLRLSRNMLSGQIPQPVADLTGLSFLDLSNNNFSGPMPKILAKDYSLAGNSFLCSSSSEPHCQDGAKPLNSTASHRKVSNHHKWVVSVAIGVSCTFVVSIILLAFWVHWFKSRSLYTSYVQQDYEFDIGNLRRFTFRELQTATNNFSPKNILGHGGFGVVYRGCLPNRTLVAVKRLKDPNFTREVQFQTEVEMIGLALHRNILRLYGFCMTADERLLVYPYMPNGSVADRLRDTGPEEPSLDWNKRIRISMGAARGFVYLHEQCNPKIIHRDVKAANILLDESFEAVVGDFGLAKLLDLGDSHVTTAVRGTVGHIAPEYLSTGQSSEKTDVFGFGILLLELITGRKPLRARNDQAQNGMILDLVRTLYEEKRVEELVDRDLKDLFDAEELEKVVELALQCTRSNPNLRPKMSNVLKVLESATGHMEDTSHGGNNNEISVGGTFSFPRNYCNFHLDSSFTIEAIELSGPR